ncbi:MAG: M20/M25/M40 family metallo-hydrolase, partial [Armatimonadetes bacterium]|nr:M20/M25/M40 family metallo-hydrolase [Anaerolineae bacterium]
MKNQVDLLARTLDWSGLPALATWVLEQALAVQRIAAPTFAEQPRAAYVETQFAALGLTEITQDALYNVYGCWRGSDPALPALMVVAHTDTVFSAPTNLTTRIAAGVVYGPGLGDNSMGVAGLLGMAAFMRSANLTPDRDVWFVATSREEGLGDLDGMRAAYTRLQSCVGAVINLEGLAFGHVYHAGIAVRRLHISAKTDGGHSWLHFGRPSAVHGIMRLGALIDRLTPPTHPRTTYNIGMIEGGQSINSIASSAALWLDMRSESREGLEALERDIRAQVNALRTPELAFQINVVGDRPPGRLAPAHPLVQAALAALAQVDVRGTLETGST